MKKISLIFALLASACFLSTATVAAAADQPAAAGGISKLYAAISQINEQARMPQGESIVAKQLERDFSVSGRKIKALHRDNTQYGDVAAALAFAEKLPGGITNSNLNEVTKGKNRATWDQVAKFFKIDVGIVAGRLSGVQENIKMALAESAKGSAAGGVSQPGAVSGGTGTTHGMGGQPNQEPGSVK
jgi:hypothetical protein